MVLSALATILIAILVLWIGAALARHIPVLDRLNIPPAVTGGVLCSVVVATISAASESDVEFTLDARDWLLLVFFSSVGMSARFGDLAKGGSTLFRLGFVVMAFLFVQNLLGVIISVLLGYPGGLGVLGGSISLAGGHGTAISWGRVAEEAGHPGIIEIGVAFATFGLICGGVIGGPIGGRLAGLVKPQGESNLMEETDETRPVKRHIPESDVSDLLNGEKNSTESGEDGEYAVSSDSVINSLFLFGLCIGIGAQVNAWLKGIDLLLPGFLTAMATGIVLNNLARWRRWKFDSRAVDLLGDVSLRLFLAMSLMSMDLTGLGGPLLVAIGAIMITQVVLVVVVTRWIVFRAAGGDYDAAVISAGFAGIALGATPVGVANMKAVTSRFGESTKAFVVVPLLGAFLLDIINAVVIQLWWALLA